MTALVSDIGGTNTRLGLVENGQLVSSTLRSFANRDFADYESVLDTYLGELGQRRLDACCVALAGLPTADGAELTNHDWIVSRAGVRAATGAASIGFINDFEALGYSLIAPERLDTRVVFAAAGPTPANGTRMVLGAGTGFNAAACFRPAFGTVPHVAAAECGHTTLAIEGEEECRLQRALAAGRGRASVERALSGNGLREIYAWVCERDGRPGNAATGAEISAGAIARSDEQAVAAVEIFLRLLGRVAGDLALVFLPHGGIYLSGGVCRALAPLIVGTSVFRDAFHAKGRMSSSMSDFSAHLLLDDRAALQGCVAWLRIAAQAEGAPG
ncbi:Glucokinase [Hyphomicrobiales bacterium]|nr:Glucokinase [Hyphomicrobiales bacterium]CAH1702066.1 Glucokinase [Hyphomicrobiales bacterium]CAI0346223.1 putative Glucokinase [Hyphomicrobiales bacterium]